MKDNRKVNESSNQYVVGQTMADYVADRLRMDIIQKRIPADSIITVKDISERYNVSLMPVRDAFHTLKGERFLEVVPYKHVKVLRIDREYVSNVYDFARAIECLLIEDLLENGDEALYTELERINNRMRRLSDSFTRCCTPLPTTMWQSTILPIIPIPSSMRCGRNIKWNRAA